MKYTILFLFASFTAISQVQPTGCVQRVNVPAEYITETYTEIIPAIVYQSPIIREVKKEILVKEKAIEQYYECLPNGVFKECTRVIEPTYETVTYRIPTGGFNTIIVSPEQTINIDKKVKVKDGYVAIVPCSL